MVDGDGMLATRRRRDPDDLASDHKNALLLSLRLAEDTAGPKNNDRVQNVKKSEAHVPRVKELLGSTASSAQRGKLADEQALRTSLFAFFGGGDD